MKPLLRWDDRFSTQETNEILFKISRQLVHSITDRELRTLLTSLLDGNDVRGLCSLEIDYSGISTGDAINTRQISAFFSKRADIDLGIDKRQVALDAFMDAEQRCRVTNRLFSLYSSGGFRFPRGVDQVLYLAQRKIVQVLGDLPKLDTLRLRFGPGATTSVKKKNACPRTKLGAPLASSESLAPYLDVVLGEMPGWLSWNESDSTHAVVEIHNGKVGFVPKSWKTDRTISTEPVLNSMVQLGIGEYIADRLKAHGQDIHDQTRNQLGAKVGSLDGSLATLDLSSASDTIATSLVADLLPLDWYLSLDAVRSKFVDLPGGETIKLEKFATMGNGFTFPLETLIFYALAYGVTRHLGADVSSINVYGDDIIVPTECVPLLVQTLTSCGFLVNKSKSFTEGPFRESCGADYLRGIDIRPCYVDDALSGASLFVLHNHLRRDFHEEAADSLLQYVDDTMKIWGPDGYGDGHLLVPFGTDVLSFLSPQRKHGYGGYTFETFTFKSRRLIKTSMPGDFVLPGYSIYIKERAYQEIDPIDFYDKGLLGRIPIRHGGLPMGLNPLVPPPASVGTYNKDRLITPLPGAKGYKRIKIYTFGV